MAFLSNIIPYLILLFVVVLSVRKPVYLLLIPFLMSFRQSIFFENVKIFAFPGRFSPDILLLVWIILIWIVVKTIYNSKYVSSQPLYSKIVINYMDAAVIGLALLSAIGLFRVFRSYIFVEEVIDQFLVMMSLFIGYFIVKDCSRYFRLETLSRFLLILVIINSIASILFILHQGLHIDIYQDEEYLSEVFGGEIITRSFSFMPKLCFFSIAYLLVFRKSQSLAYTSLLLINLLALFISYTRSFIIIAILIIVLFYIVQAYKSKDLMKFFKSFLVISLSTLLIFFIVSKVFPANTEYLINRFVGLTNNPNDIYSNSMLYRFMQTGSVLQKIDADNLVLGYGPLTEGMSPLVERMRVATWDLVWTGVIFRWGFLGLLLFLMIYWVGIQKSFRLAVLDNSILSRLSLVLGLYAVSQLIESFVSSTFLSSTRYAMGLWYLGILSMFLAFHNDNKSKEECNLKKE